MYSLIASSVHHAIDALSPKQHEKHRDKIYFIPGLSLNPNAKKPSNIVQNFLSKDLNDKTEFVVQQDVLNNRISRHKSKKYQPLSLPDLINILKTLYINLKALVYCQLNRTPDIIDSLQQVDKNNLIQILCIVKDIFFLGKQNSSDCLTQFKGFLHQRPGIQLKKSVSSSERN